MFSRRVYRVFDLAALWASTLLVGGAGVYLVAGFFYPVPAMRQPGAAVQGSMREAHIYRQGLLHRQPAAGTLAQDSLPQGKAGSVR